MDDGELQLVLEPALDKDDVQEEVRTRDGDKGGVDGCQRSSSSCSAQSVRCGASASVKAGPRPNPNPSPAPVPLGSFCAREGCENDLGGGRGKRRRAEARGDVGSSMPCVSMAAQDQLNACSRGEVLCRVQEEEMEGRRRRGEGVRSALAADGEDEGG